MLVQQSRPAVTTHTKDNASNIVFHMFTFLSEQNTQLSWDI